MYKLKSSNSVIRLSDHAEIPADNANKDYQEYLIWLNNGGVPLGSLDDEKSDQAAKINNSCAAAIIGGFNSAALGTPHHYTCTLEDQANLLGLVLLGSGGEFTCTDAAGVKARRPHTLGELKAVLADGGAYKDGCLSKARLLKDQIANAADVAAVSAIIW